jgi:hypothetical protein
MNTNDVGELLDKVNAFYSNSFSVLVNYTLELVALFGVLVPVIIQFYQNKKLALQRDQLLKEQEALVQKKEQEFIEIAAKNTASAVKDVELKLQAALEKTKAHLEETVKDAELKLQSALEKTKAHLEGAVCFQQGKTAAMAGKIPAAVMSYIDGARRFLQGDDELNFRNIIIDLVLVLPQLTKADMAAFKFANIQTLHDHLVALIQSRNTDKRFDSVLASIKDAMDKVK